MTNRRPRDRDATRTALLDAAENLFLEKGFAEASTSGIALRAGVTKSLIHHHFGSKEELWREVKRRRFQEYAEAQLEVLESPSGSDAELLRRSVIMYFRFLAGNPAVVRLMSWMSLEDRPDCPDVEARLMEMGVEKIRAAQQAGQLRTDVEPFYVLISFLALAQHWFQSKAIHCQGPGAGLDDDDAYLENMLAIFFEGLLPRGSEARTSAAEQGQDDEETDR